MKGARCYPEICTAIGQIRRHPRGFLIRHESQTEDNQDSKDHFCGPLNKRNDTKISCILSRFFRVFRGQTFPECSSGVKSPVSIFAFMGSVCLIRGQTFDCGFAALGNPWFLFLAADVEQWRERTAEEISFPWNLRDRHGVGGGCTARPRF